MKYQIVAYRKQHDIGELKTTNAAWYMNCPNIKAVSYQIDLHGEEYNFIIRSI